MQNQIKTETRLAFIQFIFSSMFSNSSVKDSTIDFENYFYKLSVSSIEQNKETSINFNKTYFKKLTKSYEEFVNNNNIEKIINSIIKFDRNYENWDQINKSIILSILSELEITKKDKVKTLLNDYINISKTLITKKDLGMINAITDKYLSDKKIKNIISPIFIMHATGDDIVPFRMGEKMYTLANSPKSSYFVDENEHLVTYDENLMEISELLHSRKIQNLIHY